MTVNPDEPVGVTQYEELAYIITSKRKNAPRFHKSLLEVPDGAYGTPETIRARTYGSFTVFGTRADAEEALRLVPDPDLWDVWPILMRFANPDDVEE